MNKRVVQLIGGPYDGGYREVLGKSGDLVGFPQMTPVPGVHYYRIEEETARWKEFWQPCGEDGGKEEEA